MSSPSFNHDQINAPAVVPARGPRRRIKKRLPPPANEPEKEQQTHDQWRMEDRQRVYSSKLIEALAKVNLNPSSPSAPRRGRAVREAADRALAVAARGRSLWSRAILSSRLKLKFRKHQNKFKSRLNSAGGPSSGRVRASKKQSVSVVALRGKNNSPAVQRKARALGRLVPGCKKQPLPVILEETTDYIAALEMQVRTMTALADLLSGAASSAS